MPAYHGRVDTFDRRTFLVAGAGLLAACSSTARSDDGPRSRPLGVPEVPSGGSVQEEITSVVVVGDSITEGSEPLLVATLEGAGVEDVRIEGEASRRIEVGNGKGSAPLSGVNTVYTLLAEGADPSAWVIQLGTNDVGSYADADAYGELIDSILTMLPPRTPVVWVNTYREQYLDDTILFNSVLDERLGDRDNAVVADWFSVAAAEDQSVLRSDNLHPNDNGQRALALLVVAALQEL